MWIFSELGFFSVTCTPDGERLHFRARKLSDVENLKREFSKHFAKREIMTLPFADYRYRIETTPAKAALVMGELTKRVAYRNFKSHLAGTDQADKLGILHELWHQLHDYQTRQERPKPTGILRREAFDAAHELDAEEQAQNELSDWLAGWPNPEDEDDSLAPPPGEPFPDWDGPNDDDDDPFDTAEHYPDEKDAAAADEEDHSFLDCEASRVRRKSYAAMYTTY